MVEKIKKKTVSEKYIPDRGDIAWIDFEPQKGKEIAKIRPALILSPKAYNQHGLAIMCPITSKVKGYPFEVKIKHAKIEGAILADHIRNLDWKQRKAKFITKISENELVKTLGLIGVILKL